MQLVDVIILAITQGLTEFLPVSSSGHLVLARQLFGISDELGTAVDAFLHLGTLVAVLWYYRHIWARLLRACVTAPTVDTQPSRQLAGRLVVATIPAALIGYWGEAYFASTGRSTQLLVLGFLITAAVILIDVIMPKIVSAKRVTIGDAVVIGMAQVLALLPSISRSGLTIAAARWRGIDRVQAVEFSFLLSAPIIAAAGLVGLSQVVANGALPVGQMVVGFVVSLVSGLVAISSLVKLMQRASLLPFVIYLVVIALLIWYV